MHSEKTSGVMYAVAAYALWGVLPIYWKFVDSVFPIEILANRIVWVFVFVIVIVALTRQWKQLKLVTRDKKQMLYIGIASILITFNWGLYIWAVNSNRIVDSSLGYYINPLFSVALGLVIFKERLNRWQVAALLVAFIGVMIKTLQYGKIPWISLGLAISFGLYGAVKKFVKSNSIVGLTLETVMITPFAAAYIALRQFSGSGAFVTGNAVVIIFLIGSGVVTAIPLLLFASGAKRLPMSVLGFTQYISPTISLLIGIFMYHEAFTIVDMVAFGFIWVALVIYSISQISLNNRSLNEAEQVS